MRCEIFVHANTQCRKKARWIAVSWGGLMTRYVCNDHRPPGVEAHPLSHPTSRQDHTVRNKIKEVVLVTVQDRNGTALQSKPITESIAEQPA
jgi:hypothetical protein